MAPKPGSGTWENPDFLKEAFVGLYLALDKESAISGEAKASVVDHLQKFGHTITWDAIRVIDHSRTMATRQTMKWDPKVHEDVLMAMFQHLKPAGQDWSLIMRELKGMGYTFTENALRQHVQKLRRNREKAEGGSTSGTGSVPATPGSAKRTRKRGGKKAAVSKDVGDDEDMASTLNADPDDEEDSAEPAAKRTKKMRAQIDDDDSEA